MAGIKIPVEAAFDKGAADAAVKDFEKQFNQLGETIAKVNQLKFTPVSKADLDLIKQVQANFQNVLKLSGDLKRRMQVTGQGNKGLLDLNWDTLYPDQHSRARQMRKVFEYVTGGSSFQAQPTPQGATRAPAPAAAPAPTLAQARAPLQSVGGRIMRAGLSAAGPLGNVAGGAISEGTAGGIGAGFTGLVGGLVALGIGKLISGIKEKVGDAQNELIGYDTLKRTLGDVNIGFTDLKEKLRLTTNGLGTTYDEALRLGAQFARTSGGAGGTTGLAMDVRNGVGFSRSFGLDPSGGVGFFAQARMYGATQDADGSRRLGLLIGEGVARSGAFAKMDEVLQAIAGYMASTARNSLTAPNVAGYTGLLTSMMGTGLPGMDAASSASVLARMNGAMMGGGSESMQNFMYRALGGGMNPFQAMLLREQGLFGSRSAAFGKGSVYARYFGHEGPGGGLSNIDGVMEQLQKMYGGGDRGLTFQANALSQMFGITNSQAMGFSLAARNHGGRTLGGLEKRLRRLGFSMGDIAPDAIGNMAAIEAGGGSEKDKDLRIAAAARDGQIETEGKKTRDTIAGVSNTMQKAAEMLVGPLNDIRAAVMMTAGGGNLSARQIMEKMAAKDSEDRVEQIKARYAPKLAAARNAQTEAHARMVTSANQAMDPASRKALVDAEAAARENVGYIERQMNSEIGDEGTRLQGQLQSIRTGATAVSSSQYDSLFQRIGREEGVDPKLLKAIAGRESGMNPDAIGSPNADGSMDFGLMQHNSRYLKERGLTNNWMDPEASIRAAAKLLKKDGVATDMRGAVRRYNGTGPRAEAYANDVMSRYAGTQLSDAALERERTAAQNVNVHVTAGAMQVQNQAGQEVAPAIPLSVAVVRRPAPAGAQ